MSNLGRREMFGLALLPFVGALAATAEETKTAAPAPKNHFAPPLSGREIMRQRYFPNLPLITHEGKEVHFYDDILKDKIVVLNLMYADCQGACPLITSNLRRVQKILKETIKPEVFFASITWKPATDTPEKLAEYARMHHVGGNWTFLTGKPEDLELLRYKLGWDDPDPVKDRLDKGQHSGNIRYGNEPLSTWSSAQGSADPDWVAHQITYVVPPQLIIKPSV